MAVDSESRPAVAGKPDQGKAEGSVHNGIKTTPAVSPAVGGGYSDIDGIADKFRQHLVVPVVDKSTGASSWTALVPRDVITKRGVSVDSINDAISSQEHWRAGDVVVAGITVRAVIGPRGLLLSTQDADKSQQTTSVHLDESGSSAHVSLVVRPDGRLEVHKTCAHAGIDENGRPWLERQHRFLETSLAARDTDIFVRPLRRTASAAAFSIDFPYLPSQTLAQLAMAGMGGPLLLGTASALLGEMAGSVWPRSATEAPRDFIEKAHFDRMDRRVAIARAAVPALAAIADSPEIVLNGRTLLGFRAVTAQLRSHPALQALAPTLIGEIHGDLNLHNILCCVGPAATRPVALIDPRGVHLLSDFASTRDFEPGDYAYELSKLKFSLSAFSEIRHGFLAVQSESDTEFRIRFAHHPGSETMRQADAGFFAALAGNADFMRWVDRVEPAGFEALRKRVLLGEAANFVADAACALGRDTAHEVVPLFLIGLDKLNSVLATLHDTISEHKLDDWFARGGGQHTTAGILAVQQSLLQSRGNAPLWDVIEMSVPAGQVATARGLLATLRGKCFPRQTSIYASSAPPPAGLTFPCVVLHGLDEVQGATEAVLSGMAQADAFFKAAGVSESRRSALRIISVHSAAAAGNPFGRRGGRLWAPGPWGASPLALLLLTAQQLRFARGGRWLLGDASFFIASRALEPATGHVCVLAGAPKGTQSPAVFLSTEAGTALLVQGSSSSSSTDVALASTSDKGPWAEEVVHRASAVAVGDVDEAGVGSISGGDKMGVYQFGSQEEYRALLDRAKSDADMNSLAFLAATLAWREQWAIGE